MQIILFYEEVNRNTSETNDTPHCRNSSKTQSRNHTEKETRYIHQHTNTSPLTFLALTTLCFYDHLILHVLLKAETFRITVFRIIIVHICAHTRRVSI
jgi:hypothetical protein